jgi:hypothetical protein
LLATFTYGAKGVPVSVKMGSDHKTSPIYYYVYNGHGDVTELTDSQGNTVASYTCDCRPQRRFARLLSVLLGMCPHILLNLAALEVLARAAG